MPSLRGRELIQTVDPNFLYVYPLWAPRIYPNHAEHRHPGVMAPGQGGMNCLYPPDAAEIRRCRIPPGYKPLFESGEDDRWGSNSKINLYK